MEEQPKEQKPNAQKRPVKRKMEIHSVYEGLLQRDAKLQARPDGRNGGTGSKKYKRRGAPADTRSERNGIGYVKAKEDSDNREPRGKWKGI